MKYLHYYLHIILFLHTIETVCPSRIPVNSRDEKGFDILLHLNLAKKAKKTQGSYYGTRAYQVTQRDDLTENTRYITQITLGNALLFALSSLNYSPHTIQHLQ